MQIQVKHSTKSGILEALYTLLSTCVVRLRAVPVADPAIMQTHIISHLRNTKPKAPGRKCVFETPVFFGGGAEGGTLKETPTPSGRLFIKKLGPEPDTVFPGRAAKNRI